MSNTLALDEISYARPDIIQWWVSEGGQPMDENMIHRYFSESPFFDWSSKNGLFLQQAEQNWDLHMQSRNRKTFEDSLRSTKGVEFIIVGEPQPVMDKIEAAKGAKTGIWVIRKQDRQTAAAGRYLREPGVIRDGEWELTVLGTYFIVGENVFQAPSVADVIGNRLLSATTNMSSFYDVATALPRYAPSRGYTYLPASAKQTAQTSFPDSSPSQSRESSLAPGADANSSRPGPSQPDAHRDAAASAVDYKDSRLLEESLWMSLQYGDEYMDENPLIGEPGQFKFTRTTTAINKRRAEEEEAEAKEKARKEAQGAQNTKDKAHSPPAVFTEAKAGGKAEKLSKEERRMSKMGDKIKRRKSRPAGVGGSPNTPTSAVSPVGPNSAAGF